MSFRTQILCILLTGCAQASGQTTTSPNMGMPIPIVGQDPGPDWANNINASLQIVDSHDHTPGHGVAVPAAGLNINSDLPFHSNNATSLKSDQFSPQGSLLSSIDAVYTSTANGAINDLYYNDSAGNKIQITKNGSLNGTPGSISGLSPPASASYNGISSSFVWQSGVNTPAFMNSGPLIIGNNVANSKTVTLQPPGGLAANYSITFPSGTPANASVVTMDASGNLAATNSLTQPLTIGNGGQNITLVSGSNTSSYALTLGVNDDGINFTNNSSGRGYNFNNTNGILVSITSSGVLMPNFGETFSEPMTLTGSHGSGNGTTFTVTNTGSGSSAVLRAGSSTAPAMVGSSTSDDVSIIANGSEVIRAKNGGGVNITGTGGNTPHACTIRTSATAACPVTQACIAGEIVVGGGCASNASLTQSFPASSTSWQCGGTGNCATYAICCAY